MKEFVAHVETSGGPEFVLKALKDVGEEVRGGSEEQRVVVQRLSKILNVLARRVEYSPAARKAAMGKMLSMLYVFGVPGNFYTFAPADVESRLTHELIAATAPAPGVASLPPPTSGADADAVTELRRVAEFGCVPRTHLRRQYAIANNPVAAARNLTIQDMAADRFLIGRQQHRRGGYRSDRAVTRFVGGQMGGDVLNAEGRGIFGDAAAHFGVTEEQGRGAVHIHKLVWGGPGGNTMTESAYRPQLKQQVQKYLSHVYLTRLPPKLPLAPLLDEVPLASEEIPVGLAGCRGACPGAVTEETLAAARAAAETDKPGVDEMGLCNWCRMGYRVAGASADPFSF